MPSAAAVVAADDATDVTLEAAAAAVDAAFTDTALPQVLLVDSEAPLNVVELGTLDELGDAPGPENVGDGALPTSKNFTFTQIESTQKYE